MFIFFPNLNIVLLAIEIRKKNQWELRNSFFQNGLQNFRFSLIKPDYKCQLVKIGLNINLAFEMSIHI